MIKKTLFLITFLFILIIPRHLLCLELPERFRNKELHKRLRLLSNSIETLLPLQRLNPTSMQTSNPTPTFNFTPNLTYSPKIYYLLTPTKDKDDVKELDLKPGEIIDIDLPFKSKLNIQGRKMVNLKFGTSWWLKDPEREENPPSGGLASGLTVDQELQVRLKGTVGEKINVNVNYDDTRTKRRDLKVLYKGGEREVVKELAFGDINLSLPNTEFVAYNKSVFGIQAKTEYKNLHLQLIGTRTKGISERKEFKGEFKQEIIDIRDTSFKEGKYFRLVDKDDERYLPIIPDSLKIYLDNNIGTDNEDNVTPPIDINAYTYDFNPEQTPNPGHELISEYPIKNRENFNLLQDGKDYYLDAKAGIITFAQGSIGKDDIICCAFKCENGEFSKGYATYDDTEPDYKNLLLLKYNEDTPDYWKLDPKTLEDHGINFPHFERFELKNHYSLGSQRIDVEEDEFRVEIRDKSGSTTYKFDDGMEYTYLQIFGLDLNGDGQIDEPYKYIDVDFGIITFPDPTPFKITEGEEGYEDDKEYNEFVAKNPAYLRELKELSNKNLYEKEKDPYYTIHIEYKAEVRYFLKPNLVEWSEKIRLNGKLLHRGTDYYIDYDSGWITFLRPDEITEDSKIVIDYEYRPFIGKFEKNVAGCRLQYKPHKAFSVGSTYLTQFDTRPLEVPEIRSTPQSLQVIDTDFRLNPSPILKAIFKKDFPVDIDLSGEIAYSKNDPNTFDDGLAIVASMDGTEKTHTCSLSEDSWHLHLASGEAKLIYRKYKDDDEYIEKGFSERCGPYHKREDFRDDEAKEGVLVLRYNDLSVGDEIAVIQLLSKRGKDLSNFNDLRVWMKKGEGVKVKIDLGIFGEDADGDGLDTEDENGNNILEKGEDDGYDFWGRTRIGAGNNRIDTEDLDGDGQVKSEDRGYFSLDLSDAEDITPDYARDGYKLYRISLKEGTKTGEADWSFIKHIRIRLIGGEGSEGCVKIGGISIAGSIWEKGGDEGEIFDLTSINAKDNKTYRDRIQDLWDKSKVFQKFWPERAELQEKKEGSLVLSHALGQGKSGWGLYKFPKEIDIRYYQYLRFWVSSGGVGEILFVRFGPDTHEGRSYFEFRKVLTYNGWELVSIDLDRYREEKTDQWYVIEDQAGSPSLAKIKELRIGIIGNGTSDEVWINELHVADVLDEVNKWIQANRLSLKASLRDWFSWDINQKELNGTFQSIGKTTPKQFQRTRSSSFKFNRIASFPFTWQWNETKTGTDPNDVTDVKWDVISEDLGYKVSESNTCGFSINFKDWPTFTYNYSDTKEKSALKIPNEREWMEFKRKSYSEFAEWSHLREVRKHTGSLSWSYSLPKRIWFIPTGNLLRFSIKPLRFIHSQTITKTRKGTKSHQESSETKRKYEGSLEITSSPIRPITTTMQLTLSQEDEKKIDTAPLLKYRRLNTSLRFSMLRTLGLEPRTETRINYSETYTSSHEMKINGKGNLKFTIGIFPKYWHKDLAFLELTPKSTLSLSSSYDNIEADASSLYDLGKTFRIFQDVSKSFYYGKPEDYIGDLKSANRKLTHNVQLRLYLWTPLDMTISYTGLQSKTWVKDSYTTEASNAWKGWMRLNIIQALPSIQSMKSSHAILDHTLRKAKTPTSITQTNTTTLLWRANWKGQFGTNLKLNLQATREKRPAGIKRKITLSPSFGIDWDIQRPWGIKIPLIKRRISLKNEMELDLKLSSIHKRTQDEGGEWVEKSDTYSLTLQGKYEVRDGTDLTLGGSAKYFNNILEPSRSYFSCEGSVELVFRF